MHSRVKLTLGALALIGALAVSATHASAQCWECQHIDNMYVCIGMGNGNGSLFNCGPTWDTDPPFTCKTDQAESCGGAGCPGCQRYPALAITKRPRPRLVSTQVLVFATTRGASNPRAPLKFDGGSPAGLEPQRVAKLLTDAGIAVGSLVGASVQTGADETIIRQLANDGTGVIVQACPTQFGANVRAYELGPLQGVRSTQAMRCDPGEMVAFGVEIAGQPCLAVVSALVSKNQTVDEVVHAFHVPFTEATEAYPSAKLSTLRADSPRSGSTAAAALMGHSLADRMLLAAGGEAYR